MKIYFGREKSTMDTHVFLLYDGDGEILGYNSSLKGICSYIVENYAIITEEEEIDYEEKNKEFFQLCKNQNVDDLNEFFHKVDEDEERIGWPYTIEKIKRIEI